MCLCELVGGDAEHMTNFSRRPPPKPRHLCHLCHKYRVYIRKDLFLSLSCGRLILNNKNIYIIGTHELTITHRWMTFCECLLQ